MSAMRFFLILIIAFLLSLSGSFGYIVYTIAALDDEITPQNSLTTRFFDINDELIAVRYVENRTEVPLESISDYVILATLAVEDRRFTQHAGIDLAGLGRALLSNLRNRQVSQGGSTITQQLARNLYLNHEQTLARKAQEAIYSLHLERRYTKEEILEKYLNTIFYGHSAYGIEAAAQLYFGKNAGDLNLSEAALLVGIPKGPVYYSPFVNLESSLQRQRVVLSQMAEVGVISNEEKITAMSYPLEFRNLEDSEAYAYFIDHVISIELARHFDNDLNYIYRGGLRVFTTLDPRMQEAAEAVMTDLVELRLDEKGLRQPQGALIAMNPQTGYIKAMVGGRDFSETSFNRALAMRSPGSSFKPVVYAAALEQGYTLTDMVSCEPISLTEGLQQPYEPTDYGGDFHHRELTLREAMETSCNISAIKTYLSVGQDKSLEMASRLGITSPYLDNYYSLPLGPAGVSLLEMTTAYAAFANGGYLVEPIFIRKVTDSQGSLLFENRPQGEKVIDEKIAFLITEMMTGVLREGGTASRVSSILQRPAAGKSGTSQGSKNAHMIGYTPQLVAGLYIGDDYEKPLEASGGRLAAPLWAEFMQRALTEEPVMQFKIPSGIIKTSLCPETGLLCSENCREPGIEEYFIEGTEPSERCDLENCSHCSPGLWWPWLLLPSPRF